MQITGHLHECPWIELLNLVERLRLTGWLKIQPTPSGGSHPLQIHQLWFKNGALVGASRNSRSNGFLRLIQRQGWGSYTTTAQIAKCCPPGVAMGQYFKQQGVLTGPQVQQLFQLQMLDLLANLRNLEDGAFHLDTEDPLPYEQMTGLQLSTYDAVSFYRNLPRCPSEHLSLA